MDGPAFAKFGKEWAKYMKRGISFFLACIMMAGMVLTAFSGCSSQDKYMNSGEWLCLINEKFGFSYMDEKAYETSVDSDSEYYNAVQIAYGYGVLPDELTDIKVGSSLTNELCALTLAGAIYEPDSREVTISDISKTEYPDAVITVVNQEIMPLGSGDKFSPNKKVLYEDAVEYLDKAFYSWKNHHYDSYMNYTLNENVVDLAGLSTYYSYEETHEAPEDSDDASAAFETSTEYALDQSYVEDQRKWLSDNHFEYNADTGIVKLDNVSEKGIVKGSVLTIPDSLEYPTGLFLKVDEVTENNGIYEIKTVPADVYDVFGDEINMSFSKDVDLSKCVIYDGDGNIISSGKYGSGEMLASPMKSSESPISATIASTEFKLPAGLKGTASVKDGNINIDISTKTFDVQDDNEAIGGPLSGNISVSIKNLRVDGKIEKFIKPITKKESKLVNPDGYHKLSLDWDTDIKGSIKISQKKDSLKWGSVLSGQIKNFGKINAPLTGKPVITIPVPILPGVTVNIDGYIRVSLEGEVSFAFAFADGNASFECRKMKPTFNATLGRQTSKSVSGSVKAEIAPQLNANLALVNQNIIDLQAELGIGAKAEAKMTEIYEDHTAMSDSKQLDVSEAACFLPSGGEDTVIDSDTENEMLMCLDLNVYKILKVSAATEKSWLGKALNLIGVSLELNIWGENNGSFYNAHYEFATNTAFSIVPECTLSERKDESVEHGDALLITPDTDLMLNEGDTTDIDISMLPQTKRKYYTKDDLVIKSDDPLIASAILTQPKTNLFKWKIFQKAKTEEHDIKITAVKEGRTTVTLSTRDGAYKIPLNVTVIPKNTDTQEYMAVSIDTFFIGATVGETVKLNAVSIPEGKTADDVFWETDDTSIVNVNSLTGEIIGLAEGSCNVMAYIPGYEKNAVKCRVTVSPDYSVTGTSYGEAAPNGQLVII